MPTLSRLVLTGFRNIDEASLQPSPGFNLIYGSNGSGKTSLLEAIYLLGMGRSFRSHLQKPLIAHQHNQATVFAETASGLTLGVQRPLRGAQIVKLGGKPAEGLAQLSRALPLQLINNDTFELLEGSPNERRQFLDWGVFHVEHSFLEYWRRARQALDQRNALLRAEASANEIEPWSQELVHSADQMDQSRQRYLQQLQPIIEEQLAELGSPGGKMLTLTYWRGWDESIELGQQLKENLERDRRYGFTTVGPHKADLKFHINAQAVAEVLSRGQLKLLICHLKVAQARLLKQANGTQCLFLVDDLPAELDAENRSKACQLLASLQTQVFMTSIEPEQLAPIALAQAEKENLALTLFHVKHGKIVSL
jgi:DNA replication and repair protein RecF